VKILRTHYDKLALFVVIIVLTLGIIFSLFQSFETTNNDDDRQLPTFLIDSYEGDTTLEVFRETDLIPGDRVLFFNNNTSESLYHPISKVIFNRKSRVLVTLNSQNSVQGKLLNSSSTILTESWQKIRTPLALETKEGVLNLNFKDIARIKGQQILVFSSKLDEIDPKEYSISTYQNKLFTVSDSNRSEKIRWTNNSTDANASIYDLFTPPIIYLVNGELTTSLPEIPEEEEKEEEFGLVLKSFEKDKFRLKLSSWIGQTPYFEDLLTKVSANSSNNVKNRIEVNVPYKINPNYRPGLPSFIKTTLEDEEKYLMVEYFTVEEFKDAKTGGSKPVGRALVKDYNTGNKSFEINSLMGEVFSGEYKIQLIFEIEGELPQDISLSAKDVGKKFEFGNRNYEVIRINEESKTIEVSKEIKGVDSVISQTLSL
jgi:hypothetical protein